MGTPAHPLQTVTTRRGLQEARPRELYGLLRQLVWRCSVHRAPSPAREPECRRASGSRSGGRDDRTVSCSNARLRAHRRRCEHREPSCNLDGRVAGTLTSSFRLRCPLSRRRRIRRMAGGRAGRATTIAATQEVTTARRPWLRLSKSPRTSARIQSYATPQPRSGKPRPTLGPVGRDAYRRAGSRGRSATRRTTCADLHS
jgi:hypothetical protein